MPNLFFDCIGYIGCILIILSFLTASDLKMRMLNVIGSLAFIIYGLALQVYPFALTGAFMIAVHLYRLLRTMNEEDLFTLIPVTGDEPFFQYFLSYHEADITRFFPDFNPQMSHDMSFVICLNAIPVGIFLANQVSEYELEIVLDYAAPRYRDYSLGRFLYRQLTHIGFHKAIFHGEYQKHIKYLKQMEFTKEGTDYIKTW